MMCRDENCGGCAIVVTGPAASALRNAGLLFGNYAGSANSGNWGQSIAQGLTARLAKAGGTGESLLSKHWQLVRVFMLTHVIARQSLQSLG